MVSPASPYSTMSQTSSGEFCARISCLRGGSRGRADITTTARHRTHTQLRTLCTVNALICVKLFENSLQVLLGRV